MRVLILSQYFPPETGATANRMLSLAREVQAAGHDVVVITEKPNHPEGVIREAYRGGPFTEASYDGVPVLYTWVHTRPEKGFWGRIFFYLSFMGMAVAGATRLSGRFDVVLASSPPLFVGLAGWAVARLKRARFVFDVRDLWPEVAVAMGVLRAPAAIRAAMRLERFLYDHADGITAVTESFCQHIRARTGTPVRRVMNGTVPALFQKEAEGARLREACGLEERFVVTYAGNVGLAQDLSHVLEAAETLQRRAPEVLFRIVGHGPARRRLRAEAQRRGLANVAFVPRVPLEAAAVHMAAADALLVPLGPHPIYRKFIPSKLFDGMASGRAVLLSVEGEARALLEAAGAGCYYPPGDARALVRRIEWLRAHPAERTAMGRRGRAWVRRHGTRRAQARRMIRFMEQRVQA